MARAPLSRAPSQNAYKGSLGQTRTEIVHVTGAHGDLVSATVHTSIDALANPDLVERLFAGTINTVRVDNADAVVACPLVYHDPAAEVFVLILADAQRHRELDERIALLERLRADRAAVPAYVKDFAVVFGAAGLRTYLERKAQQMLTEREASKRSAQQHAELDRVKAELERTKAELERVRTEARPRALPKLPLPPETSSETTTISPAPKPPAHDDHATKPVGRQDLGEVESALGNAMPAVTTRAKNDFETDQGTQFEAEPVTGVDLQAHRRNGVNRVNGASGPSGPKGSNGASVRPGQVITFDDAEKTGDDNESIDIDPGMETAGFTPAVEVDEEPTGSSSVPTGGDPLTTQTHEIPADKSAPIKVTTSSFSVKDGTVRLVLIAGEQTARGLTGELDVRMLLHRLPTYPVVTVIVGQPAAMRAPSPSQLLVVPLDIGAESDRAVLGALAKKFEITADIVVRGVISRRVRIAAPLAENVTYIQRAADDHLRGITADGETEPSYPRARDVVLGAGYDLLGVEHAESSEFRDDKLSTLSTAQHVRRAIAVAKRFARPSREDYLVCARGYPLTRWRELRRRVLDRAVACGLWMGPELAQIAVSEGLARSRRDLVAKLVEGFEVMRRSPDVYDLDADATEDNTKALAEEARALGVELRPAKANGAIKSEDVPAVSGSIERPSAPPPKPRTVDELLKLLDDRVHRVEAASELCERGDARAAVPVINSVKKMSRAEAVRILGRSVKFGAAAAAPLTEGLQSSKAFLRHGCALALALLRTDEGTHAVIEQLLAEPTEIWREMARALGQVGPTALMPLASHVGRLGDAMTPKIQERVAWAMAHVGVRGGKPALEQMAAGQSVMAPIARQAIGLHSNAARDEVRVRPGGQLAKDMTVNRAFSRRFFEALEADKPDIAQAALHDLEASGPSEVLEDDDLLVDDDDEAAELDESDLIQT